jgi:uncharacterized membrane protein YjjP (DUF1212 family)
MMMNDVLPTPLYGSVTEESQLLVCMRKIGKGMIAAGTSVGVVENTLNEIAFAYDMACEVVALPNIILIKLGQGVQARVDISVQRLTTLRLDQISELVELIEQIKLKRIMPGEAVDKLDRIATKPERFHSAAILFGCFLSSIGLTMRFRPEPEALLVTGGTGILVGMLILWFQKQPRFSLLLPTLAAILVSSLTFALTMQGWIFGTANLIIPPLVTFLPGAALTTGMIELASMQVISGSARLIYGTMSLLLLFVGIAIGFSVTHLPESAVYAYELVLVPWWAPILGTLLFGLGTFIRVSGANRDLLWILLVLYIAMLGQVIGERYFTPYIGAFIGAMLMAVSSELIARSPRRTPALASQMLAYWFLVPGATGLLSVTSLLVNDLQSVVMGLGEMVFLIIAIALGVLLGTLVTSPQKFSPISIDTRAEA